MCINDNGCGQDIVDTGSAVRVTLEEGVDELLERCGEGGLDRWEGLGCLHDLHHQSRQVLENGDREDNIMKL